MGLRVAPLALEAAHDGTGGGEHPRFGFVAEEIGNPRGGASAIAREALEGCLANPMVETVVDAVVAADARVKAECRRGQGAAFASCLVHSTGSAATLVHLGDCRIHLFRGGLLECLSRDHTLWNQYLDLGHSPEGMNETWRSIVVRALGMVSGPGDVVPNVVPCLPGDVFVLTADGLHSRVSQHELCHALRRHEGDPGAAERAIATMAERRGVRFVRPGVRVIAIDDAARVAGSSALANDGT